jgi:hypothetical protein
MLHTLGSLHSTYLCASTSPSVLSWPATAALQGDVPDNARRFWRLLMRKGLQPGCLAGLNYALFGLGDSGYPEFNVSGAVWQRCTAAWRCCSELTLRRAV